MITILNDKDIVKEGLYLLYFYTAWMPFNKRMYAIINNIHEKYNIPVFCIDADHFKDLNKKYRVESVPVLIGMLDFKELKRLNGVAMASAIKSFILNIKEITNGRKKVN